jgi:hypothetical protein
LKLGGENKKKTSHIQEILVGEEESAVPEADPAHAVPDPPAAVDNWANPTDAGEERNTVYTFFRKVSPIIQEGPPGVLLILPKLAS